MRRVIYGSNNWHNLSKDEKEKRLPVLKTLKFEWKECVSEWLLPYFHHYDYRHLLRSAGDLREFTGLKYSCREFHIVYDKIATEFLKQDLPLDGITMEHTAIISKILKVELPDIGKLYREYDEEKENKL